MQYKGKLGLVEKSKFSNNGTLSPNRCENQLRYDAKAHYGISLEAARELRKRTCSICGCSAKKMVIDHTVPKTFRGVLCQQCNVRLGWYEKNRKIIETYCAVPISPEFEQYSVKRKAGRGR
jgi:hypothetical protein